MVKAIHDLVQHHAKISPTKLGHMELRLLADEAGGLLHAASITTVTFYRGAVSQLALRMALRTQLFKVVSKNPWLAGRLIEKEKVGTFFSSQSAGITLRFPKEATEDDISPLFDHRYVVPAPRSGYAAVARALYKSNRVVVEQGRTLLDDEAPVCKLTVAESEEEGVFALVFSLAHAVGDGRTYYDVLRMLQPGAEVRTLRVARVHAFGEAMRDRCNREALAWVDSPSAMCHYLPLMMGCGRRARCHAFFLDPDRVAAAKRAQAGPISDVALEVDGRRADAGFVSTNDILTSGFFTACRTTIGVMGLDCRGRLEGITEDLAGNYATALVLDEGVFESPAAVRAMYATTPYATTTRRLPGCCCAGRVSFGQVSDWASFAHVVELENCETLIHLPVKNPAEIMWDEMIPFKSHADRTGVLCWTVSTDEEGLRKALPVGDCVSRELFPG